LIVMSSFISEIPLHRCFPAI